MKKKLFTAGLILLIFSFPIFADDLDDNTIFRMFMDYTQRVYQSNAEEKLAASEYLLVFEGVKMSARVLGYSLGNLLQYARRGSENHKIWLMLESETKESMFAAIDYEGRARGWDQNFIENRKQKAWQQCMAAMQGWFDNTLAVWTNVNAKNAPNFFETLRSDPAEIDDQNVQDADSGSEGEGTENPRVISDEILGKWTWTHEYKRPHTDQIIRQKFTVDVRRAGAEERSTAYGSMPVYLYEGYVLEIENVTNERSQPLAAPGDLCWKIKYTTSHRAPSEDVLGYTFNSLLDRMGEFSIRLLRGQGILEIGRAKYYR